MIEKCWLRSIGQSPQGDICIYTYDNELAADGLLSWQEIEDEGADFCTSRLAELETLRT